MRKKLDLTKEERFLRQSIAQQKRYDPPDIHILKKRRIDKMTGCWEYTGPIDTGGYGHFRYKNKMYRVHRLSYTLYRGEIKNGLFVCHTCDNRKCFNPDHLWLGTNGDNIRDASQKNRLKPRSGEKNNLHKLTTKQVLKIRKEYPLQKKTQKELGLIYGVDENTIWCILNRVSWKHI